MPVPGSIRMHLQQGQVVFFVEGQGTMHLSPVLRKTAEAQLAAGACALRVDLRRCTYLDSTFLGTLVALRRSASCQASGCDFALVSPSPECRALLKQMRMSGLFRTIDASAPQLDACVELVPDANDLAAFQRTIVTAHQELAELSGLAGDPFRAVAARMTKEFNSGRST